VLKFMSITKVTLTGTAIIALLGVFTTVHEYQRAEGAEEALAKATHARSSADQKEAQNLSQTAERPHPQPKLVAENTPTSDAAKPPAASSPLTPLLAMLGSPVLQQQMLMQAKIRLDGQYGELFRKLGLTSNQLDQFKNLLIEK